MAIRRRKTRPSLRRSCFAVLALLFSTPLAWASDAGATGLPPDRFPDVARAYWVELDGRPLWSGRARQRMPMASLAKLMTALLLVEDARLDGTLVVSRAAAAASGTRLGLQEGDRARARDLFVAMLIRSANDACRALADWHGGDLPRFVARMNQRAEEWGARDTRFANACGHDDDAAWSTAADLAQLARRALASPTIRHAVQLREYRFTTERGRLYRMGTTNALLGRLDGAKGLKTGYTPGAGRCLIAYAERDGHTVLAVLLDASDRWWDSVGLIELAFDEARPAT